MANYSGFRITLLAGDYPTKYDNLVTAAESVASEVETARGAYGSLNARIAGEVATLNASLSSGLAGKVSASGLTANLSAGGYRITGAALTPLVADELVTKHYADSLGMSAALPGQAGNAGKVITTDGSTAYWADLIGEQAFLTHFLTG